MKSPASAANPPSSGAGVAKLGWDRGAGTHPTPKTRPGYRLIPHYRFRAIGGQRSQPHCQQCAIFLERRNRNEGQGRQRWEEEEDKGQNRGHERGPISTTAIPGPLRKRRHAATPPLTFPQSHLYFRRRGGGIEAGTPTLRTELGDSKPSAGVSSEATHRSIRAPGAGSVFLAASPGAVGGGKRLEMAPKPSPMAPRRLGTLPRRWTMLGQRASAGSVALAQNPTIFKLIFG